MKLSTLIGKMLKAAQFAQAAADADLNRRDAASDAAQAISEFIEDQAKAGNYDLSGRVFVFGAYGVRITNNGTRSAELVSIVQAGEEGAS
jgi:hypothetical protein